VIEIEDPGVGFAVVGFGRLGSASRAEMAVHHITEHFDDERRLA
jgi:hypothetical protein